MAKYLIKGSVLECDKGEKKSKFEVSKKSVSVQGKSVGTTKDCKAGVHIKDFGSCKLAGKCKLQTELLNQNLKWENYREKTTVEGHNVITEKSYCMCPVGGKITVKDTTQIEGNAEKNALLKQVETALNLATEKVTNNMLNIRNDMGLGDKEKLNLKDKMKIYRKFEETNPYYENYGKIFGENEKNIMKEKVLDEVLYQVRTKEGYTWMSKRDAILLILVFFMLFDMLDSETLYPIIYLFSASITLSIGIGAIFLLSMVYIASTGLRNSTMPAPDFSFPSVSLPNFGNSNYESSEETEPISEKNKNTQNLDLSINIGNVGYVQGIDTTIGDLGLGSFEESFSTENPLEKEFFENIQEEILRVLEARIGKAIIAKDYAKAQTLINELEKKSENLSFETYIKYGKYEYPDVKDKIYIGKTSGVYENKSSPREHVRNRNYGHRRTKPKFYDSVLDKSTHESENSIEEPKFKIIGSINTKNIPVGDREIVLGKNVINKLAIDGREQLLIEAFGGKGHLKLENTINSISSKTPISDISKELAKLYYGKNVNLWKIPSKPSEEEMKRGSYKTNWKTVREIKKEMGIN